MTNLTIPVLLGTSREGRQSESVARWIIQQGEAIDGVSMPLVDVRSFTFEPNQYADHESDTAKAWIQTMSEADGLIIVAPEYNHGYPGRLKEVLDTTMEEYYHKPVGLIGVSSGGFGGTRVIENLLPVVRELGMYISFKDLPVSRVKEAFDEEGTLLDESYNDRAAEFLKQLTWLAATLKPAREAHLAE